MKRLIIYCEGPTEEQFVTEILAPYLWKMNVSTVPKGAGGVSRYSIIKKDLTRLCKNDPAATITTMLDYYGLQGKTPGVDGAYGTIYDKVQHIEMAVEEDLGRLENLIFNLSVHEYEGLLFSHVSAFESIADDKQLAALKNIREKFETPEHINDSFDTAPSKRIEKIIPGYSKVTDGTKVAQQIGIAKISSECRHFEKWMTKLVAWAKEGAL